MINTKNGITIANADVHRRKYAANRSETVTSPATLPAADVDLQASSYAVEESSRGCRSAGRGDMLGRNLFAGVGGYLHNVDRLRHADYRARDEAEDQAFIDKQCRLTVLIGLALQRTVAGWLIIFGNSVNHFHHPWIRREPFVSQTPEPDRGRR